MNGGSFLQIDSKILHFVTKKLLVGDRPLHQRTRSLYYSCCLSMGNPLSGAENSWQSQHENETTLENSMRQSKASRLH
jgi:hypothetical protein